MLERPSVMTYLPGSLRSAAASAATAITDSGRPARSSGALEDQHPGALVGEDVLAEGGADLGEALVDRLEPGLAGGVEARAGADEIGVVAVDDARLFGAERGAVLPHGLDAAEQGRVEVDRVPVRREERRHLALDRLQVGIGVGAGQVAEDRIDAGEAEAGCLERDDRVVEGRGLRRCRRSQRRRRDAARISRRRPGRK